MAVHNHGPNEGRGVDCHERLVGDCIYDTLTPAPAASGLDDLKPDGWHTYHVCGGLLREIVCVDGDQLMCTYCGEWYRAARLRHDTEAPAAPEDER